MQNSREAVTINAKITSTDAVFYISYISLYRMLFFHIGSRQRKNFSHFCAYRHFPLKLFNKSFKIYWSFKNPLSKKHRLYNGIWETIQAAWKSKYCFLHFVLSKAYEEKSFQMLIPPVSKSHSLAQSYLDIFLAPLKAIAKLPLVSMQTEYSVFLKRMNFLKFRCIRSRI